MPKHKIKNKVRSSFIITFGFVAIVGVVYLLGQVQADNARQNMAGAAGPGGNVVVQPNCRSFFTPAIKVTPVFVTATNHPIAGNNNDSAEFIVKFTIKAGKCDLYISRNSGDLAQLQKLGASVIVGASYGTDFMSQYNVFTPTPKNNWKLSANTTNDFWIKFYVTNVGAGSAGQYRAYLHQIKWGTSDLVNLPNVYKSGMGTPTNTTPYTTNYIVMN